MKKAKCRKCETDLSKLINKNEIYSIFKQNNDKMNIDNSNHNVENKDHDGK